MHLSRCWNGWARARVVALSALLLLGAVRPSAAQEPPIAHVGFVFRFAATPVEATAALPAMLRQRVTIKLERVTIERALQNITTQARLDLSYSRAVVPLTRRVSVNVVNGTVAEALRQTLQGVAVELWIATNGKAALVPATSSSPRGEVGTIVGRITDAKTGDAVSGADVFLEGTRSRGTSNDKGYYRLADVTAGSYTLVARRVGYAKQTKPVVVAGGQELTADVALQPVVTQLDEIVTTVTGDRQLRELGHVVGRINADSLVKEAPISSVTELLTGRIPGLQVFQTSGIVGGDVQLKIRSPKSFLLGNQPIIVVDGVRFTSTAALDYARAYGTAYNAGQLGAFKTWATQVEATSPLNDLNPNNIETIEVVKGSAASTLYGTDAANGVIVITTKRGKAGPTIWSAYTRLGIDETPKIDIPKDMYFMWGTRHYGPYSYVYPGNCTLAAQASGDCTQDSLKVYTNPNLDPSTTILASSPMWTYGARMSGGSGGITYAMSGAFDRQTGPLQMPPAFVDSIEAARGIKLPDIQRRPNTLRNINLSGNIGAAVKQFDLRGNIGYVRRTNQTVALNNPYTASGDLANLAGRGGYGAANASPEQVFARTSVEQNDRVTFSSNASWRPLPWLQARSNAGIDISSGYRHSLERRGEANNAFGRNPNLGDVQDDRTQQRSISGDLSLNAHFTRGRLSSRTSVGTQYVRQLNDIQTAWGTDLIPGGESVSQAANRNASQAYAETVTLGTFVEQVFGLNDRLFLTAAVRVDGASNFGQDYESAAYPKANVSWTVSEEPFMPKVPGLSELRLRYAYGISGQQAYAWMAKPSFAPLVPYIPPVIEGRTSPLIDVTGLGNPHLRPERSREHEFGFDAVFLDGRLRWDATWVNGQVKDQIVSQTLPPTLGQVYQNLGLTKSHGFETTVNVQAIDTRSLSWNLSLTHSLQRTKVVEGGDVLGYRDGYPLDPIFNYYAVTGYNDANNDGVIANWELTRATDPAYLGESTPPISQTLTSSFNLFSGQVGLSASLNRSKGNLLNSRSPCVNNQCPALLVPGSSVEDQVAAYASQGLWLKGDYTRLREVQLTFRMPPRFLGRFGVRSGAFSFSARNLALWTSFKNGDPDSIRLTGTGASGGTNIPQARSYTFRFDLDL